MARPKLNIDEEKVAELAFTGASTNEIALAIGVSDETLRTRFRKLIDQKRAERRIHLRKLQTIAAEQGIPALLIWLGKVELDQTERHDPPVTKVIVEYADRGIDDHPEKVTDEAREGSEVPGQTNV